MEIEEISLTEDELLAAIKESGLSKSFQAYIQKYSDQKVTEGIRTREKNIQAKNLTDSEKIANLETELKELKDEKAKDSRATLVKAALKEAGLSEGLTKYVKVNSDDPSEIAKSVSDLKDDLTKIEQDKIDLKLKEGETPPVGAKLEAGSLLENYIKNGSKTTSPFKGKISESEGEKK